MVSLTREKIPPKLENTYHKFNEEIKDMSVIESYAFYKNNSEKYRYNTKEVKDVFQKMNAGRCSFCTKCISDFQTEMTVEHIELKKDVPGKIFLWGNLLCSCRTCNVKRGTKEYDKEKYLDPTKIENIEDYFKFNIDGTIGPAVDLSEEDKERVNYMIDLYDLMRESLKIDRRKFIKDLIDDDEYFDRLKYRSKDDLNIINLAVFKYYMRRKNRYGK